MNINTIVKNKNCTSCNACINSCPMHCIQAKPDEDGFIYPKIDISECNNCSVCYKVCPVSSESTENKSEEDPIVYAAKLKDKTILKRSSSGGMFPLIANYVLSRNGIVFGCILDESFKAIIVGSQDEKVVKQMSGSKYVQSDTGYTYLEVKKNLESNKLVLYTGTPCQIAGLKKFLKKSYDNLITLDLICHGVPSPKFFNEYIKWLEKKHKCKVIKYEFRNKEKYGWDIAPKITFDKKEYFLSGVTDPYNNPFLFAKNYRECCYKCRYANFKREGDFTIGDYWGIEKYHSDFCNAVNRKEGFSLLLVNSEKGKKIFEEYLYKEIDYIQSKLDWAIVKNENLVHPAERSLERDDFYKAFNEIGFQSYAKSFFKSSLYIKYKLRSLIPSKFKGIIKNIIIKEK